MTHLLLTADGDPVCDMPGADDLYHQPTMYYSWLARWARSLSEEARGNSWHSALITDAETGMPVLRTYRSEMRGDAA